MPQLVCADESGLYLSKYRSKPIYGSTYFYFDRIYTLEKYDLNFKPVFSYQYKEESSDFRFEKFLLLKKRLYIFSYTYKPKEKKFTIYCSEINKETGKLLAPFKEILAAAQDLKNIAFQINIFPTTDSNDICVSLKIEDKKQQTVFCTIVNQDLKQKHTTTINTSIQPELYRIREVFIDSENLTLLAVSNRKFKNEKRQNRPEFSHFTVEGYDKKGQKLYEVNTGSSTRHVINQKTFLIAGKELIIAGAYNNDISKKEISGLFVDRYDIQNGKLIATASKELPKELIEQIKKRIYLSSTGIKDEANEEGLPNNFIIKSMFVNPITSKPTILAEVVCEYITPGKEFSMATITTADVFVIEIDEKQELKIATLPKKQVQRYQLGGLMVSFDDDEETNYNLTNTTLDDNSSFSHFIIKDKLIFFINDNPANATVTNATEKTTDANNIKKSNFYAMGYDFTKGIFTRKFLQSNAEQPIPLTKNAFIVGNEVFFLASLSANFLSKPDFKFIKVIVK